MNTQMKIFIYISEVGIANDWLHPLGFRVIKFILFFSFVKIKFTY